MADASQRGEFVWHDLLTPNAAGAHEFYGKAIGWNTQPWEGDPSYVMFTARSGPVGGSMEERSATPHWLPYIGTDDADATVEAATRLGARVQTPPSDLPNGGRYAVLFDPQGAAFGVYASSEHSRDAATAPQTGEFSWHELATSVAPSIAFGFYAALFDWDEINQQDMGPMGMYLIFGRDGRQIGGMFDQSAAGKSGSAYWLGYVSVDDLDAAVQRAKDARGSVVAGPMDVPGGDRIAQLMDPHGAFFALHKAAGPPAAATRGDDEGRKPARKAPEKSSARARPARKTAAKRAKKPARKKPAKKPAGKKKAARATAKSKRRAKPRPAAKTKPKKKTKKRGR